MTILETLQVTNGLAYLAPQSVTKKKRSSVITLKPGQWPQLELLLVGINRPLPILGSCRKSSKLEDGVIGTVRGQLLVRRFPAENSKPRLELETRFHNSTRCQSYKTASLQRNKSQCLFVQTLTAKSNVCGREPGA
jgi:hypothetical protein